MQTQKNAHWIEGQNSYTFWYECSNCGYGIFDGWDCNQVRHTKCPKCKASMTNGQEPKG